MRVHMELSLSKYSWSVDFVSELLALLWPLRSDSSRNALVTASHCRLCTFK